jgi:hypothetical protein
MKPKIPSSIECVHLEWDGPKTWKEKDKLKSATDYGIYQIYGCHPVHGADCLLYIGKACNQPFAVRLKQEVDWMFDADFGRLSIYVGRCSGWNGTPSDLVWTRQIDLSEKLLILAHRPGWNAQKNIDRKSKELSRLHIFNWGCYRSLLPEVSGLRYTTVFDDEEEYRKFKSKMPR